MKVKAVDIARALHLSKASVSLALNGKPGVSRETREAVLRCREALERGELPVPEGTMEPLKSEVPWGQTIKIIMFSRGLKIIYESELDLWTDVLKQFDREAKKSGYTISITYAEKGTQEIAQAVADCKSPSVAGVILYATEMREEDFEEFRQIGKPMIVYDNDFGKACHSVVIDNVAAVRECVDFLVQRGCRSIRYLAQDFDIYNFVQRRAGLRAGFRKNGIPLLADSFLRMGTTIDSVERKMRAHLEKNALPDAYIMENYQISIGVLKALRALGLKAPGDVSLIGVDELPSYATGDQRLVTVRINHVDRAKAAMMFLLREIGDGLPDKFKIMSRCTLLPGDSVRE